MALPTVGLNAIIGHAHAYLFAFRGTVRDLGSTGAQSYRACSCQLLRRRGDKGAAADDGDYQTPLP